MTVGGFSLKEWKPLLTHSYVVYSPRTGILHGDFVAWSTKESQEVHTFVNCRGSVQLLFG